MTPAAALVALACYAPPPAPLVSAPVLTALQGEAVAAAPSRPAVADAVRIASRQRRRHP
jgi:hypothetical protein